MELPPGSDRRLRLVKIASKQETKTMSTMMIYIIIIAVSLLLIIGFLASANEFKKNGRTSRRLPAPLAADGGESGGAAT